MDRVGSMGLRAVGLLVEVAIRYINDCLFWDSRRKGWDARVTFQNWEEF